jgi:hypothetical protein
VVDGALACGWGVCYPLAVLGLGIAPSCEQENKCVGVWEARRALL